MAYALGILAKDFNGGGALDLLVAGGGLRQLLFLAGHDDGTFDAPQPIDMPIAATAVQAADLDGDHLLDVVVLNDFDHDQIAVALGNGDGTFQAPTLHAVAAGQSDLALADVNHDGAPDILVTSWITSRVYVLLNDRHGGFPVTATELPNWGKQPGALYAAKFDADDFVDLVVAGPGDGPGHQCPNYAVLFVKGNGNGTFADPTAANCSAPTSPNVNAQSRVFSENVAPDLNADGHPDIVFTGNRNYLDVGLGDGAGHFGITRLVQSPGPGSELGGEYGIDSIDSYGLATGDFDHDGVADIAVANASCNGCRPGGVSVVLSTAPGMFHAPRASSAQATAPCRTPPASRSARVATPIWRQRISTRMGTWTSPARSPASTSPGAMARAGFRRKARCRSIRVS